MTHNNKICIHGFVSGKVQGVFYRDTTRQKAEELNLTGWIKNCDDGSVEILVCGERDHIMELTDWLWQGPPNAQVSNVHWEETTLQQFDSFEVKR